MSMASPRNGSKPNARQQFAIQRALIRRAEKANRKRVQIELYAPGGLTRDEVIAKTGLSFHAACQALDRLVALEVAEVIDGRYQIRGY